MPRKPGDVRTAESVTSARSTGGIRGQPAARSDLEFLKSARFTQILLSVDHVVPASSGYWPAMTRAKSQLVAAIVTAQRAESAGPDGVIPCLLFSRSPDIRRLPSNPIRGCELCLHMVFPGHPLLSPFLFVYTRLAIRSRMQPLPFFFEPSHMRSPSLSGARAPGHVFLALSQGVGWCISTRYFLDLGARASRFISLALSQELGDVFSLVLCMVPEVWYLANILAQLVFLRKSRLFAGFPGASGDFFISIFSLGHSITPAVMTSQNCQAPTWVPLDTSQAHRFEGGRGFKFQMKVPEMMVCELGTIGNQSPTGPTLPGLALL
ncbi:hypothetical protein BDM02DRAFT_3133301 [Thelephora ganbajun]|uniref:Uncharacterized protein n=1 Tax=Thelephora ganbajun TaxID=370292 RepID=A0ACB6YY02_THEGA|nr:hypothetical protein BDM02DRAFT_3133301 [Thelephora ganbajun]